jgi:hypothetical protein
MSKLKMAALAAAMILAGANALAANETASGAATKEATDPADPMLQSWTFGDAGFIASHAQAGTKKDTFTDTFTFTLTSTDSVDFGANTEFSHGPEVGFTGWSLFDVTTGVVVDHGSSVLSNAIEVNDELLTPGSYALTLTGSFVQKQGLFDGYILATPAPEPTEWAMMAAGLGLMGALARRRQANKG